MVMEVLVITLYIYSLLWVDLIIYIYNFYNFFFILEITVCKNFLLKDLLLKFAIGFVFIKIIFRIKKRFKKKLEVEFEMELHNMHLPKKFLKSEKFSKKNRKLYLGQSSCQNN